MPRLQRIEEKFEPVAACRGVVVLQLSLARYLNRPDVTRIPVSGAKPARVCLAWKTSTHSPLLAEFVAIVR